MNSSLRRRFRDEMMVGEPSLPLEEAPTRPEKRIECEPRLRSTSVSQRDDNDPKILVWVSILLWVAGGLNSVRDDALQLFTRLGRGRENAPMIVCHRARHHILVYARPVGLGVSFGDV